MEELLKQIHEALKAAQGDAHDAAVCALCNGSYVPPTGGNVTKTDEDLAALAAQNAELLARVAELEADKANAAELAKITELEAQISELQNKVEVSEAATAAAKKEHEDLLAYLADEKAKADADAEAARLKEDRIAKVKEVASFDEATLDTRGDRWARMEEAEFASFLEDLKAGGAKPTDDKKNEPPAGTELNLEREIAKASPADLARTVARLHGKGVPVRTNA